MIHRNIKVFGEVQGVIFRYSAKEIAEKLNLKGFTQNLEDGAVYIEVEGNKKNLDEFLDWCKKGPPLAKVEKVEFNKSKLKNFSDFTIL